LKCLKKQIGEATLISDESQKHFESILVLIDEIQNQETVIDNAMSEQSAGSAQIVEAVKNIGEITVQVRDGARGNLEATGAILDDAARLTDETAEISKNVNDIMGAVDDINEALSSGDQNAV